MLQIVISFISLTSVFVYIYMSNFLYLPISIFLLIVNCFFLLFFKKWIGPFGLFYMSTIIFLIAVINNIILIYINISSGSFMFIDLGQWFFSLDILSSNLILCFDNLALMVSIVVLILALIAHMFGIEYMAREIFISRLIYLLNLFSTSVLFLFIVYDFFLVLIAWELIGLFSFLLVNFYSLTVYTLKSSLKTFIFSRLSDFFIFFSFNLCILIFNTTDMTVLFLKIPFFLYHNLYILSFSFNVLDLFTMFLALASVIKAAQFGFHVWLPDAMNAPTPASSLIHSSTLVIMGIYLIIRFNLVFEFTPVTNYFLIILGSMTICIGSLIAVFQTDIKKLVAYSTISQMGYLVSGCGFCAYDETIIYLIMHAINKAFLFIIVGYVVHFYNSNTDMRLMGNLIVFAPDIAVYFLKLSLNLAGLPFSSGFYSKEFLLFQVFDVSVFSIIIKAFWLISFIFTPIYMFILIYFINFNFKKNFFNGYFSINTDIIVWTNYSKFNLNKFFDNNYLTSKSTCFVLLGFFVIFNLCGDYLFLLVIEYLSQIDSFFNKNYFNMDFKYYYSTNLSSSTFFYNLYIGVIFINIISLKILISFYYKNNSNIWLLLLVLDIFLFMIILCYFLL